MRRKQNIQDAFHSVVPQLTAGPWSVGYSGHTDNSNLLQWFATNAMVSGETLTITNIRNIDDVYVPGTTTLVMNDVYVDYAIYSGSTLVLSGTTSIYDYTGSHITTTTTTVPRTTTTTTVAPTTTTTTSIP